MTVIVGGASSRLLLSQAGLASDAAHDGATKGTTALRFFQ